MSTFVQPSPADRLISAGTTQERMMTVRLIERLYIVASDKLTHPWDANAYLIAGDEPTLIDCGSSEGYPALKRNLKQLGYAPHDIRRVIATHGHWDHISGMAQLRAESDAELWLHAGDRAQVETGDHDRTSAFLYDRPFAAVEVDRLLRDGEILEINGYEITVHHTPGHSPGAICLQTHICGMPLLITGDTVWGGFHPKLGSNLEHWAASLDRLLELDFDVLAIGHSSPTLIFDAKRKVREARQQFGVFFDPWFKPFNVAFMYRGL